MIMQRPPRAASHLLLPTVTTASAPAVSSARPPAGRWVPRIAALLLGAAAAASLAYWGLRLWPQGAGGAIPAAMVPAPAAQAADPDQVARLLAAPGAAPASAPAVSVASRLVLTGVAAARSGRGTALIAVDGQSPKPFVVGATVAEGLVLQSVQGRRAALGPAMRGPSTLVLELPPLPR